MIAIIVLYGGTAFDLITTRVALSMGFVELNKLLGQNLKRQFILMFASSGGAHLLSLLMPPDPATAFIATVGVVHFVVGVLNVKLILGRK